MKKYLAVIFLFASLFLVSSAIAEKEFYSFGTSPSKPVVFDPFSVSIGIKNSESFDMNYKLYIWMIKDGVIKDKQEFVFNLGSGDATFFSPVFYPNDIGNYEIIARLYDKFETKLISSKVATVNVISEIGPFDLILDVPTDVVKPQQILPLILTLANMGEKGTDVEIQIELPCINSTKIENSFFVFLNPKSSVDKMVSIPTCQEEGLHDISAHIILFNKTFITSINQVMINKNVTEVSIGVPDELELKKSEPKIFSISIKNNGIQNIHNLRLLIEKIPMSWMEIYPDSISEIKPDQTVVFIVNITVPSDASLDAYPVKFIASADEFLKRADSKLKVLNTQSAPSYTSMFSTGFDNLYRTIPNNSTVIGISIAIAACVVVYIAIRRNGDRRSSSFEKVRKLKSVIKQ